MADIPETLEQFGGSMYDKVIQLYYRARGEFEPRLRQIERENSLYNGDGTVKGKNGKIADAQCLENMTFELIETQISNAIPLPKVTARRAADRELAASVEQYLRLEMDRLDSELLNDRVERGVLKHGSHFYHIYWDTTKKTKSGYGAIGIRDYSLNNVIVQPGIARFQDAQYLFTIDDVPKQVLDQQYHGDFQPIPGLYDVCRLITYWYINTKGYVGRYGWIENTDQVVFDDEDYESRRVIRCSKCHELLKDLDQKCPVCGSESQEYAVLEEEVLPEDLLDDSKMDEVADSVAMGGNKQPDVIAPKGTKVPFYHIRQLPFVLRVNISDELSIYGKSDVDILEQNQETLNKINTKMAENILKAGSFVTHPADVHIPNDDSTLKRVAIKDPRTMQAFSVQTVQANVQQDNVFADRMYAKGRSSLGITDSYQGKRDTTAESGKAKQIAAAQSAGRLESKRRMKEAAYGEIYRLMFKFLLAYSDDKQYFIKKDEKGDILDDFFYRYSFLYKDENTGELEWNDDFLFSVDNASILSSNRESMWQETMQNFQSGTFGNPQDPLTLQLYWEVMSALNYPLAQTALKNLQARTRVLPYELQLAIMDNPAILQQLIAFVQNQQASGASQPQGQAAPQGPPVQQEPAETSPVIPEAGAGRGESLADGGVVDATSTQQ